MENITWTLTGFLFFFATGLDDLSILFLLTHQKTFRQRLWIYAGTLIGVCIMLTVAYCSTWLITATIIGIKNLFAGVPILLAIYYLLDLLLQSEQSRKKTEPPKKQIALLFSSLVLYLCNMSDDLIVNSATIMQHPDFFPNLAMGNFLAALMMCIAVQWLQQQRFLLRYCRHLAIIILFTIGVLMIINN